MRSCLAVDNTIIYYQMHLKVVHQNNLPNDIFSLQILCGYISASQTGTNMSFMVI